MTLTLSPLRQPRLATFLLLAGSAIYFAGCNSDPEPITSQTSKYEVANQESPSVETPEAGVAAGTTSEAAPPASRESQSRAAAGERFINRSTTRQADDRAESSIPKKPSSTPPSAVKSQAPSTDDPKQLLAYMEELSTRQPQGTTRSEALARYQETQQEIVQVADQILSAQADDATRLAAAEGKVRAYSMLAQLGQPQANQELRAFLASLSKSKHPDFVRLAQRMTFAQQMDAFSNGESVDPAKLLKDFQGLFDAEQKDTGLFVLGRQVAMLFMDADRNAEALEAMKLTHATFHDHAEPQIAAQARSLGEQIIMLELDINHRLKEYLQGQPDSEKALLETLDQLFASKDVGPTTLQIALQIGKIVEMQNMDAAKRLYDQIRAAFEKHSDPEIAKSAVSSADNFGKRHAIIGKPFTVEGVTLKGTPFDWSKYQGKIVLVDFWATWCRPCLEEIPNIRQNYEQHREQGFEVVGFNIDEDVQQVEQFFSLQQLPWTTVRNADAQAFLDKCGVETIPFLVLVGRDGNVVALNVRGEKLGEKLAELLAPDANSTDKTSPKGSDKDKTSSFSPGSRSASGSSFVGADDTGATQAAATEPGYRAAGSQGDVATQDTPAVVSASEPADATCSEGSDDSNPYLAASGLSPAELVDFILEMQDKPQSIQQRAGFASAIADAADRILAGQASDKQQLIAIESKFAALHRAALAGDSDADKLLSKFVEQLKNDQREGVAREIRFFQAERTAMDAAQLTPDKIDAVLIDLRAYLAGQKLTARHLRLASATVEAINKLPDESTREKRFQEFGNLFAKSEEKALARYGARLAEAQQPAAADWIGKPLELKGTTVLGTPLNWSNYRGKVVVVDIWATWCGPCSVELPKLKALHEKLAPKGFDVVGVSVDEDAKALEDFLGEHELPWITLAGQEAFDFAKRLGVAAIPTMLLVDTEGKVVAVSHGVAELAEQAETLLAKASK